MGLPDTSPEIPNQNQSNQNIEDLIKDARNSCAIRSHPPTHKEPNHVELPSWIDPKAIQSGKDFARRHFFLIFFTHFISLILLLSYVPVKLVLLQTKRSHTKALALTRYLSTLRHVKLWYEGDLSCVNSAATKDVIKIRQIHSGVYQRLKHSHSPTSAVTKLPPDVKKMDLTAIDENNSNSILSAIRNCTKSLVDENSNSIEKERETSPHIISQLDLIVTQFCFMGLVTTFPEKFGLSISSSPQDAEGLKGFTHMWAVIGHHLGIEDRFNLCLGNKSALKRYILHEILMKDFSSADSQTFALWEALVSAMSVFVPCLSLRAALMYFLEYVLEINENISEFYDGATLYDLFCYKFTIVLVNLLFHVTLIRNVFSSLLRLAVYGTYLRLSYEKKLGR